ncbi:hypothetical protein NTGHW29_60008 [Candidatus Nitrotoga sp. HW29]|nr:hypothetical protein NTGHW29_60008 [Candidatus Nitrotoga sp. HW29]
MLGFASSAPTYVSPGYARLRRAARRNAIPIAKMEAAASARLAVEDAGMGEGLVTIRVRVCDMTGLFDELTTFHVTT